MAAGLAIEIASMALYPEVALVLEALRRGGLKWAVVSNLAAPYAEPLLKIPLRTPDARGWSFAVGRRKPDDGLYLWVCRELKVEPSSEVLMVGDSLENDFRAPKRLGMGPYI